jgi:hypothetical protein
VSNAQSPLSHWLVDRIPSMIMIPWNFMSHLQKLSHTIWLFNVAMENPQNKWRVLVGKSSVSMGHGWAMDGPWLPWRTGTSPEANSHGMSG